MRLAWASAIALALSFSIAHANDSSAALGAGGLTLLQSADIRMASEDLFVSRDEIRVRYSFLNESQAPITTRVAFPMPEADLDALGESDIGWPTADPINIVDFRVTVDGRAVKPALEQKAFLKGVDVTDVLVRLGAPLGYPHSNFNDRLMKLSPAAKKELTQRGLADFGGDVVRALWTVRDTFHWEQTFQPGRALKVEHAYKPVVGGSFIPAVGFFENPDVYKSDDYFKQFCIDDGTLAGIKQRLRAMEKRNGQGAMLLAYYVDYVLTTGRNWKGPIGDFKLTIDKGRADNIVSFCMSGVKKTGPTTFVVRKSNFEPDADLHVMIVETPEGN